MDEERQTTPLQFGSADIPDPPLTAGEAAAYLRVTVKMLAAYEKQGLVTWRLGTGPKAVRRWYRSDIDRWIRRGEQSRCSPEAAA